MLASLYEFVLENRLFFFSKEEIGMKKIFYEFLSLWLLSKAGANAAFRSNQTTWGWSSKNKDSHPGTVQQNIPLTELLAAITQTTKEKCCKIHLCHPLVPR